MDVRVQVYELTRSPYVPGSAPRTHVEHIATLWGLPNVPHMYDSLHIAGQTYGVETATPEYVRRDGELVLAAVHVTVRQGLVPGRPSWWV